MRDGIPCAVLTLLVILNAYVGICAVMGYATYRIFEQEKEIGGDPHVFAAFRRYTKETICKICAKDEAPPVESDALTSRLSDAPRFNESLRRPPSEDIIF